MTKTKTKQIQLHLKAPEIVLARLAKNISVPKVFIKAAHLEINKALKLLNK